MSIKHNLKLLNFVLALILLVLSSVSIINLNGSMKNIEMLVSLEDDLGQAEIEAASGIVESLNEVKSVKFLSPEKTAGVWAKTLEEKRLLKLLGENPFPPLFLIKMKKTGSLKRLHQTVGVLRQIQGIKEVEFGGKTTERAVRRGREYLFGAVFVFFAALINILNHLAGIKNGR